MSELFSRWIKADGINFKYARGLSDRNGMEFHPFHEIILFMGGEAQFISDKMHITLKPDTLIMIPKESYHQLIVTGSREAYFRCVISFLEDVPMKLISESMKDIFVTDINTEIKYLFGKLINLTESNRDEGVKAELLKACLLLLLTEIAPERRLCTDTGSNAALSARCIEYISEHFCDRITVADIARKLNVSVSSLTHSFKNDMQISIHQYILKKRLIMAHQRILSGEASTRVAVECGFSDYSGFYKQYKKMFNMPPSSTSYSL